MRKTVFTLLLLLSAHVAGQDIRKDNLFSIGFPLTDSKYNFINLFNNYPRYIDNADQVQLMYYQPLGILENKRQVRRYIRKNFPPYAPTWGVYGSSGGDSQAGDFSKLRFTIEASPFFMEKEHKREMRKKLEELVLPGYEVWKVVFQLWGTIYDYYMFVNPENKEVVRYGNLFGVTFMNHSN